MNFVNCLILLVLLPLVGCSLLDRRDYSAQMNEYQYDEPLFRANSDFMVISGDEGRAHRTNREINSRVPATFRDKQESLHDQSLRRELSHLESKLHQDEFYKFDRYRDQIGSNSEQIYFLRLSAKEREEYLIVRRIKEPKNAKSVGYGQRRVALYKVPPMKLKDDVSLGMTMDGVVNTWGNPVKRDIAGNPKYKNERWAFKRSGKIKYIYFESGQVQGWSEQ